MRKYRSRRGSVLAAAAVAALAGACSDATTPLRWPTVPASHPTIMEAVTSTSLTGTPGSDVSPAPAVRVRDQNWKGLAGVPVTFSDGAIDTNVTTDVEGIASIGRWVLRDERTIQTLTASSPGLRAVQFTVAVSPSPCEAACLGASALAFVRGGDIFRLNADGTTHRLTNLGDTHSPAWSPDGTRIAFARWTGAASDIYIMNADGSALVRRTVGKNFHSPAWSPDGRTLAVSRGGVYHGEIHLLNVNDDGASPVPIAVSAAYAAWSPDGKKIAFVRLSGDDGYDGISVMNGDGSQQTELTPNAGSAGRPTWSPDAKKIAFVDWDAGTSNVLVVSADGSGLTSIVSGVRASVAAWSPDGTRIAFTHLAVGSSVPAIAYVRPEGGDPLVIVADATSAAWSP